MIVIRKVLYARIRLAAVSTIALALIALVILLQVSGPARARRMRRRSAAAKRHDHRFPRRLVFRQGRTSDPL
jgi:hypothetical protein